MAGAWQEGWQTSSEMGIVCGSCDVYWLGDLRGFESRTQRLTFFFLVGEESSGLTDCLPGNSAFSELTVNDCTPVPEVWIHSLLTGGCVIPPLLPLSDNIKGYHQWRCHIQTFHMRIWDTFLSWHGTFIHFIALNGYLFQMNMELLISMKWL